MRVLLDGSNHNKINKIAITTVLNGLLSEYKDSLYVIYTGNGHVSNIVDEWVSKCWPASSRNCFNGEWFMKHWSGDCGFEGAGSAFVHEVKPDLIFLFGHSEYKFHYPARNNDIPIFLMEKL